LGEEGGKLCNLKDVGSSRGDTVVAVAVAVAVAMAVAIAATMAAAMAMAGGRAGGRASSRDPHRRADDLHVANVMTLDHNSDAGRARRAGCGLAF